jgi:XTP/dITP diphosphohydrolase
MKERAESLFSAEPARGPSVERPLELIIATSNRGKALEFGRLLGRAFTVRPMPRGLAIPGETGQTFAENARQKAWGVFAALGLKAAVLGDDSGLEVEALGGLPGVRSARYAGETATDQARVEKLLGAIENESNRRARFVCRLALVLPQTMRLASGRTLVETEGTLEGTIEICPRGSEGFGYDPVFRPLGWKMTLGEARPEDKDAVSHRGRAAEALIRELVAEGLRANGD